ncbi:phage antirepressor [Clostridium sp. 'deep sea']|uniref:BRO-N domain-containing protein n=1 Tax=Clostridium sp. 'deep sea' TaxID=2779445 RepID=UPI0018964506|nr:BRO family protein [Clostridium sp. 'deep sea']QOR34414.1 phage antirepressor [Clostridium sp. 'deep sea']
MNSLQVFNNSEFGQVRSLVIDNEPWFVAGDICKCLGVGNPSQALNRLDEDEKNTIILNEGIGNPYKSAVNEYGLYNLILGSRKPEAKKFKRWVTHEVLPSIRKTGSYISKDVKYLDQLQGVKFVADDLKVNQGSRILMYQKACKANNVDSSFLPAYSEEKLTKSLTDLLKQFNVEHSARSFNTKLIKAGIVEIATRPSTKAPSGFKNFKRLTDKGLKYGKNLISPSNQRETQPHYYIDTFQELVDKVSKN